MQLHFSGALKKKDRRKTVVMLCNIQLFFCSFIIMNHIRDKWELCNSFSVAIIEFHLKKKKTANCIVPTMLKALLQSDLIALSGIKSAAAWL